MSGAGPLLPLWAGLAGLALPLQPMDGLMLAGCRC